MDTELSDCKYRSFLSSSLYLLLLLLLLQQLIIESIHCQRQESKQKQAK
jgi:hypothetical protein